MSNSSNKNKLSSVSFWLQISLGAVVVTAVSLPLFFLLGILGFFAAAGGSAGSAADISFGIHFVFYLVVFCLAALGWVKNSWGFAVGVLAAPALQILYVVLLQQSQEHEKSKIYTDRNSYQSALDTKTILLDAAGEICDFLCLKILEQTNKDIAWLLDSRGTPYKLIHRLEENECASSIHAQFPFALVQSGSRPFCFTSEKRDGPSLEGVHISFNSSHRQPPSKEVNGLNGHYIFAIAQKIEKNDLPVPLLQWERVIMQKKGMLPFAAFLQSDSIIGSTFERGDFINALFGTAINFKETSDQRIDHKALVVWALGLIDHPSKDARLGAIVMVRRQISASSEVNIDEIWSLVREKLLKLHPHQLEADTIEALFMQFGFMGFSGLRFDEQGRQICLDLISQNPEFVPVLIERLETKLKSISAPFRTSLEELVTDIRKTVPSPGN